MATKQDPGGLLGSGVTKILLCSSVFTEVIFGSGQNAVTWVKKVKMAALENIVFYQ